jgi:hypothetical protein
MAISFCPGYNQEPFATLVASYPGKDVHPVKDFRVVGASVSQGTVGWDGANPRDWSRSRSARNSPPSNSGGHCWEASSRVSRRLGFNHSYVLINTFLYSVFGQGAGPSDQERGNHGLPEPLDQGDSRLQSHRRCRLGGLANTA